MSRMGVFQEEVIGGADQPFIGIHFRYNYFLYDVDFNFFFIFYHFQNCLQQKRQNVVEQSFSRRKKQVRFELFFIIVLAMKRSSHGGTRRGTA